MPSSHNSLSDQGSNLDTPAASTLDDDRLASMADEGSVSGALMELDDDGDRKHLISKQRRPNHFGGWRTLTAAVAFLGLAVLAAGWLRRNA